MVVKRGAASILAIINLILHAIRFAFAAVIVNDIADLTQNGQKLADRPAALQALLTSLVGGAVGLASIGPAFIHCKQWNNTTRYLTFSFGLMAWLLVVVSFGFVIKAIRRDEDADITGTISDLLYGVFMLTIILTGTQLLYTLFTLSISHHDKHRYLADHKTAEEQKQAHTGTMA